jgi:hypothetical protein
MEVYLGPVPEREMGAGGSGPKPGQCQAALDLNTKKFGGKSWIRGHILNDKLGGAGDAGNLTPLSADANKNHSGTVEGKVKTAVQQCRQYADQNPNADVWYGVYYKVTVSTERAFPKATDKAEKAVARSITCTAHFVTRKKNDTQGTPQPANPPKLSGKEVPALNIDNLVIHCNQ